MRGFLLRLAISAFGLWVAAKIVPGVSFDGTGTLVVAAWFASSVIGPSGRFEVMILLGDAP